jgi:DNA replication protein DnaC
MTDKLNVLLDKFKALKLPAMAEELSLLIEKGDYLQMSSLDILEQVADAEIFARKNHAFERRIKQAHLSDSQARLEDIDYKSERKINRAMINQLSDSSYISKGRNVLILGATGTGKSYLSNALAVNACENHKVKYVRMTELFIDLKYARIEGDIRKTLRSYEKVDLLIIDDFLLTDTTDKEQKDLMEIFEYRGRGKSTILCSQLSPKEWHRKLGAGHVADAILDRITNNSYTIELHGESMRRRQQNQ